MKTDGKFIIESGGITQGIQKELGLSNEECKQLQKNSVWEKIINEVDDNTTVENNNNEKPNKENGYKVYKNAVISFTKDAWQRIVALVNMTLKKNIEIENDTEQSTNKLTNILSITDDIENIQADEKIGDVPIYAIRDIMKYTKHNSIEYANQKAIKIGDEWFDFDEYGRVERVYAEEPNGLKGWDANSFSYIIYDELGNIEKYLTYKNRGQLNPDGSRTTLLYDNNGKIKISYTKFSDGTEKYVYVNLMNEFARKYGDEILLQAEMLDEAGINAIIDKINNEVDVLNSLDWTAQEKPLLYHFLASYGQNNNESFLESLAKKGPNGKKLAEVIIKRVIDNETKVDEDGNFKYTKDILDDIESHRNDYHKLTIDLMRIMTRGYANPLYENYAGDILEKDTVFNSNGELDERVYQVAGDCWLIASLLSITDPKRNPNGRKYIKSLIKHDEQNHTVTVELKEIGRTYTFSESEVLSSNHLSTGDDDLRIIEIAYDKYRRDMAYEKNPELSYANVDIEGGRFSEVVNVLYGNKGQEYNAENLDIAIFNKENMANCFYFTQNGNYETTSIMAITGNGDTLALYDTHEYNIVRCDEKFVYFTNPHNTNPDDIKNNNLENDSTILKLPIQEFLALKNLNISSFELPENA